MHAAHRKQAGVRQRSRIGLSALVGLLLAVIVPVAQSHDRPSGRDADEPGDLGVLAPPSAEMVLGQELTDESLSITHFKRLLSTPPPVAVESLTLEICHATRQTNVYLQRWQTNAFLIVRAKSLDEFSGARLPGGRIVSQYDEDLWYTEPFAIHHANLQSATLTDFFAMIPGFTVSAQRCLSPGLGMLRPGSATWTSATEFRGEVNVDPRHAVVGYIAEERAGTVKQIEFAVEDRGPARSVEYEYTRPDLPPGIPSRWLNYTHRPDGTRLMRETEIISWRSFPTNLPREAFNPEHLVRTNDLVAPFLVSYTNGVGYYLSGGRVMALSDGNWFADNSRVIFIVVVALILLLGPVYFRSVNKRNQPRERQHP